MPVRPKISVLIPTYNFAQYLQESIDSVLMQDWPDFELLIADDASSDGTRQVLNRYLGTDPRIRIHFHEANIGMVENWNCCLREAKGDYVKFVFGDDLLSAPDALRSLMAPLENDSRITLSASAREVIDDESAPTDVWRGFAKSGYFPGPAIIIQALWDINNRVGEPSCTMFRRSSASRGFDTKLRQIGDLEMWIHLLTQGDLFYNTRPLCSFRRHENQQTAKNGPKMIGPNESLILTARYFDIIQKSANSLGSKFTLQFVLHQRIYYSRKHAPRSAANILLEKTMAGKIPGLRRALFGFGTDSLSRSETWPGACENSPLRLSDVFLR